MGMDAAVEDVVVVAVEDVVVVAAAVVEGAGAVEDAVDESLNRLLAKSGPESGG